MDSQELTQKLQSVLDEIGDPAKFNDQFDSITEILDDAVSAGIGAMEIQACASEVFGYDPNIEGMIRLFLNGDRSQLTQLKNYLGQSLIGGNFSMSFYPTVETVGAVDITAKVKEAEPIIRPTDAPRMGIADADLDNVADASGVVMQLAEQEDDGTPKKKSKKKSKKSKPTAPATLFADDGSESGEANAPKADAVNTRMSTIVSGDDDSDAGDEDAPSTDDTEIEEDSIPEPAPRRSSPFNRPSFNRFDEQEDDNGGEEEEPKDDGNPNIDSLKEAFKDKTPEEIDQVLFEIEDKVGSKVASKIRKEAMPDEEDKDLNDEDTAKVKEILSASTEKKPASKDEKKEELPTVPDTAIETHADEDTPIPEPTEPADDVHNDNTSDGTEEESPDDGLTDEEREYIDDGGDDTEDITPDEDDGLTDDEREYIDGADDDKDEPEEVEEIKIEEEPAEGKDEESEATEGGQEETSEEVDVDDTKGGDDDKSEDPDDETDDEDFDMPSDDDDSEDFEWDDEVDVVEDEEEETPDTSDADTKEKPSETPEKEEASEDKSEDDKDDEELPETGEVEKPETEDAEATDDDEEDKDEEEFSSDEPFNKYNTNQFKYTMTNSNFAKLLDRLTPEKASEALTIVGSKCGNEVADAIQAHCVGGKCDVSLKIPVEKVKRIIEVVQKSSGTRNFSGEQKERYNKYMDVFAKAFSVEAPKPKSETQLSTLFDDLTTKQAAQALTIIGSKCGNEVAKATQAMALSEFKHFSDVDDIDYDAVLADFPQDDVEEIVEDVETGVAPEPRDFSPRERMQYRKYLSMFSDAEAEADVAEIEADVDEMDKDMEDAEKALEQGANFARRRRSRSRSRRSRYGSGRGSSRWFADKKDKRVKNPCFATDSDIDKYAGKYVAKKPEVDKEDMVDYLTAKRELLKSCAAVADSDGDKKLISAGKKANKNFQKVAKRFKKDYNFTPDTDKLTKSKDRSWEKKGLSLIEGGKNKTKPTNMSKIYRTNFAEIVDKLEDLTPEGASEVLVKVDEECGPEAADALQMSLLTGCNAQFADVNGRELAGVVNRAIATIKRRGEQSRNFSGMSKFRYLKNLALFSCAFSEDEDVELIEGVEAPVSDEEAIDSLEAPEEFADKKKECECGECDDCKAKEEKKDEAPAEKKEKEPKAKKADDEKKADEAKDDAKEEPKAEEEAKPVNQSEADDAEEAPVAVEETVAIEEAPLADDEEPANVGEIVSDGDEAQFVEDTTVMPEVPYVADEDDEDDIAFLSDGQYVDDEGFPEDPEGPDFIDEVDEIDEEDLDLITDEDVEANFSKKNTDATDRLSGYDYILGNNKQ